MGEWYDFGRFEDRDEEEPVEDVEYPLFDPTGDAGSSRRLLVCESCRGEYCGDPEDLVHETVVDLTQRYPALDFSSYRIARLTIRGDWKYVALDEACQACWSRETWRQMQRAYGYLSR